MIVNLKNNLAKITADFKAYEAENEKELNTLEAENDRLKKDLADVQVKVKNRNNS